MVVGHGLKRQCKEFSFIRLGMRMGIQSFVTLFFPPFVCTIVMLGCVWKVDQRVNRLKTNWSVEIKIVSKGER